MKPGCLHERTHRAYYGDGHGLLDAIAEPGSCDRNGTLLLAALYSEVFHDSVTWPWPAWQRESRLKRNIRMILVLEKSRNPG